MYIISVAKGLRGAYPLKTECPAEFGTFGLTQCPFFVPVFECTLI